MDVDAQGLEISNARRCLRKGATTADNQVVDLGLPGWTAAAVAASRS